MKLQTCRPSFFDARDAIIQADQVLTGGENFCELWAGFSERGLGQDAKVINRTPWGGGIRTNVSFLPSFVILEPPLFIIIRVLGICRPHCLQGLRYAQVQGSCYLIDAGRIFTRLWMDGCSLFKCYWFRQMNAPILSFTNLLSTYLYHITYTSYIYGHILLSYLHTCCLVWSGLGGIVC